MFFASPPDVVETSRTTEIHYSAGKTLYYLVFGALATCFAVFLMVDSWKEHGAQVDLLFPAFFLCIFGSMFLFYLVRIARLDRPPVAIGPEGVFDKRCMTAPIPWSQIRRVLKRTRSVNKGQLHYIVLFVEDETLPKLRGSHRWFRRYRKFRGLGDVAILASNLTGSHRKLMQVTKAYARAYGAPAAEEWS